MDKNKLRKIILEAEDTSIPSAMSDADNTLNECIKDVMRSYQNANKWLDSIKEALLMDIGCVFFSTYIHNLAHTMPVRFDKFGDIVHTCDIKIPYPATESLSSDPTTIDESFTTIFAILDSIKNSLLNFIKFTDGGSYHGMACAAEALLNDIESEYPALYRMRRTWNLCGDAIKFDKWVAQYVNNINNIIG